MRSSRWTRSPSSINKMKKVINIAHRGFTRDHPDNTLEAFKAALELKVDGVEFDVQETGDREFVVFHDDEFAGKPFAAMRLEEARLIRLRETYRVPTLEEALQILGGKGILLVELKQVRSVEKLIGILRAHTDMSKTAIVSFSRELIERVGGLDPDIMRAVIGGESGKTGRNKPGRFAGLNCADVTGEAVDKVHAAGSMVFVWDCCSEADVRRALTFDIDGIISDYPDVVKEVIA